MATTPYPLPREARESAILMGNGTAGPYGPSSFKIFDVADVVVLARVAGSRFFSNVTAGATVTKTTDQAFDTFSVTFAQPVQATTKLLFQSRRVHERQTAVTKGGAISGVELEKELSKQGSVLEELRRDLQRSVCVDPGEQPLRVLAGSPGELMKTDDDGNVAGSGENVQSILGATQAAVASAVAATGSAAGAHTSEVNATTAAESAAAALASIVNTLAGWIHGATDKATPTGADEIGIADSAAGWGLARLSLTNLRNWLFTSPTFTGTLNGGPLGGFRNKIINGDGRINQRTYTTVADDVYWCDRHYVLTQTAAITPTVLSNVANGLPSMMRLKQSQAAAQRMGNAQIVEGRESRALRGKQVTLGGTLRCSASQPIRYAVLEWTGAEDAVTSDVVNDWTSSVFTAGQFFLAGLTVAAVGTITPNASALTKWSQVATISGACNNLIVFLWTEGVAAQGTVVDMTWGLVEGDATAEAEPFAARNTGQELALCQRYGAPAIGTGRATSATAGALLLTFPTTLRTSSPSLFVMNSAGAIREMGVASRDLTSVTFVSGSNSAAYASFISSGMTAGNGIALDPMLPRVFADMEL